MKTKPILLLLILILNTGLMNGQIAGKKPFDNYYKRKGILFQSEPETKNVFFFTSNFPFSLGRIENSDEWRLNPAFSIGNGGIFVFGKSTMFGDQSRRIVPVFSFGIAADVGVKQEEDQLKTTFNGNLIFGFHKVNLMLGYDFLNHTNYIGLALSIDLFAITPNSLYVFREWDAQKLK
jgi:hypothetical protein